MDRRIAISDIHGCIRTFEKLIFDILCIDNRDLIYLLGDYINKGPGSREVLDRIFQLQVSGISIICLRGNHEQYLINALTDPEQEMDFLSKGGIETLQSFGVDHVHEIPEVYLDFLCNLPLYYELDDYFLVHAGLDFGCENLFENEDAMLNIREMKVDSDRIGGKKILHGHVPSTIIQIMESLDFSNQHLSIDGGCVYSHIQSLGNLTALELDNLKLYFQPKID